MVATFNGWDDMPEAEREALEQWEKERMGDPEEVVRRPAATDVPGLARPSGETTDGF